MSLKVWQVDPMHLTPYYDAALCAALARAGCQVCFATSPFLYDPAFRPLRGYQTVYLYSNPRLLAEHPYLRRALRALLYSRGHRRLLRALEADPPDVVHVQWSRMPRLDGWLIEQLRRRAIPVVHTVHDVEPPFAFAPSADPGKVYVRADRLIVHAQANREELLERFPYLQPGRINVIRHIAPNWHVPAAASRSRARRDLGLPEGAPVLLFFGSIRSYKGLDVLIDTVLRARRVRDDLWIVIAGRLGDGHALPFLRRLDDQAVVRLEYVPSDQIWRYHLAADVAVFPYRHISQSGALITAMCFGLPVIVSAVGGLPETLDGNGWNVPPDDPAELARVLVEAVSDPQRLEEMGRRSRQIIRSRHTPERIAEQTIATYQEAIDACSASSTLPIV